MINPGPLRTLGELDGERLDLSDFKKETPALSAVILHILHYEEQNDLIKQ
jgi:hypothetical protein